MRSLSGCNSVVKLARQPRAEASIPLPFPQGWLDVEADPASSDLRGMRGVFVVGGVFCFMALRNAQVGQHWARAVREGGWTMGSLAARCGGGVVAWLQCVPPLHHLDAMYLTALPNKHACARNPQVTVQTVLEKRRYATRMRKSRSKGQGLSAQGQEAAAAGKEKSK